jgi:cytoskeletal protein CcmA (bactofilin family)
MWRSNRLFGVSLLAVVLALPPLLGSIYVSNNVYVGAQDVVPEDLYAVGGRVTVAGTVEGDLLVLCGGLTITGTVEGDVIGLVWGSTRISGEVAGSVRLAGLQLEIDGEVHDDVSSLIVESRVSGDVGRDVLVIAGEIVVGGRVQRDVRAQAWSLEMDGAVGGNVEARVDSLLLGGSTRVEGDLSFRASGRVSISDGATVAGIATRRAVLAPVWAKAVMRLFVWLGIAAFLVAGMFVLWLFPRSSRRAVETVGEHPWRSLLVGLAVLVVPPLLAVPLFLTIVGLPVAVLLLLAWLLGLVLGPVPVAAWLGRRLLPERCSLYLGFLVGAVLWRSALWLFSLVAALVYLVPLLLGLGGFVVSAWETRRAGLTAGAVIS